MLEGTPYAAEIAGVPIGLYRRGAELLAIGDICPHQGDVYLSDGYLEGETIECPMHQSCFSLRDGAVLAPPAEEGVASYAVRVEDGAVFVELEGER